MSDTFEKLVNEGPVDGSKLLREDEILSEEDKARPKPETNQSGEVIKKKPCANCTCGLKDMKDDDMDASKSTTASTGSCGSCHLGDAFRCASCPYKGMPAFKPGEKVTLDDL